MTIQLGPTIVTATRVQGAPVSGPITSHFGQWEDWRRDRGWGPHQGIDIGCDEGTQVVAPAPGTVIACGYDPIGGNWLHVQIDDEAAVYGMLHFRDLLPWRVGDHVEHGQVLGLAGQTGAATGPHVHLCLGFIVNGMALPWVDPVPYMVPALYVEEAPTAVPEQAVIPEGFYPEALAKLTVHAQTRGLAGAGGVFITDEGDHYAVRVNK